jgi:hypothetical protein
MAKEDKSKFPRPDDKYRRVEISSLDRGRRGKHHDLVEGILQELAAVPKGSALEVPLDSIDGIGLANLRSAVHRGAQKAGYEVETVADANNFYVWKMGTTK